MNARASVDIDTSQLVFSVAMAIAEAPFAELENQSRDLAAMAACGVLTKQVAVDVAYAASLAAIGAGTWYRHEANSIQEIISAGFEMEESKPEPAPKPLYRTPQSTVDAFWYVVRNEDADYLADWLAWHPLDAAYLHKIWKEKCSTAPAK